MNAVASNDNLTFEAWRTAAFGVADSGVCGRNMNAGVYYRNSVEKSRDASIRDLQRTTDGNASLRRRSLPRCSRAARKQLIGFQRLRACVRATTERADAGECCNIIFSEASG